MAAPKDTVLKISYPEECLSTIMVYNYYEAGFGNNETREGNRTVADEKSYVGTWQ